LSRSSVASKALRKDTESDQGFWIHQTVKTTTTRESQRAAVPGQN
ncbi:hypothetical protein scyTo_0007906, partial [Scyliorhinus torazame]|nr:hypothetical protein [Scyliorhinus torazame]